MLGAFQVAADGRFVSHTSEAMASGCPGGSPELTGAAGRVVIATEHTDHGGAGPSWWRRSPCRWASTGRPT
ncbi:MAG: hypothetical protein OEY70_05585 [Acidimicrobiia bacterium]|nr:hypothetical protein [Acidimicrobiia bacterium]